MFIIQRYRNHSNSTKNMEDVTKIREIVEELEKKIYSSESIFNNDQWEIYKISDKNNHIIFTFQKEMGEKSSMEGDFFFYFPKDKIIKNLIEEGIEGDKIKREIEKLEVIRIKVYTPDPTKNLNILLREDNLLLLNYYIVSSHEAAHLLLVRYLDEESRQRFRERLKEVLEYAEKISVDNSLTQQEKLLKFVKFYIEKLYVPFAFYEVYAHSISILVLIEMLKKGKASVDDTKRAFENLLFSFFKYGSKYLEFVRSGNLEIRDFSDLKTLDHSLASYIISSFLLKKLNIDQLVDLYENFERNIDTIEKLFREIKEYSREEFLKEVRKL